MKKIPPPYNLGNKNAPHFISFHLLNWITYCGTNSYVLTFSTQALFGCLMPSTFTKPLSDGDAESIQAFYGFYGNPIYRCKSFMDMTKVVTLTKTEFFQALWIWILGFWLFWVWLQPDGFRAQYPLRGIPLCWLMLEIGIELASSTIVC